MPNTFSSLRKEKIKKNLPENSSDRFIISHRLIILMILEFFKPSKNFSYISLYKYIDHRMTICRSILDFIQPKFLSSKQKEINILLRPKWLKHCAIRISLLKIMQLVRKRFLFELMPNLIQPIQTSNRNN